MTLQLGLHYIANSDTFTLLLSRSVWEGSYILFNKLLHLPFVTLSSKLSQMLEMNPNYGFQSEPIAATVLHKQTLDY